MKDKFNPSVLFLVVTIHKFIYEYIHKYMHTHIYTHIHISINSYIYT